MNGHTTTSSNTLLAFTATIVALSIIGSHAQNPEVNTRTIDCADSSPPLVGYDRIQDIRNDQLEEYERIENGQVPPRPPYVFRLCPNTVFSMDEPLEILLSGMTVTCGPNLRSSDSCVFQGGFEQVIINEPTIDGYTFEMASFVGVTFDGFSGSSISAFAAAPATFSCQDCVWQNFNANFAVDIGVMTGAPTSERMRVEITDGSVVQQGQGGTFFSNDMGTLVFDDVSFLDLEAISVIATSNMGVTMLHKVIFDTASVNTISSASNGGIQNIVNTTVTGLTAVNDVFSAQGAGSRIDMFNVAINNNRITGASPFTGVRVLGGASATVRRSEFIGNTGVSFGYLSRQRSNLELIDIEIRDNVGVSGALTAVTYVDDNSNMTLRHLTMDENFVFTAQVFALMDSRVDVFMTCINSGGGDTVLFMGENTIYTDEDNYISPDVESTTCSDVRDGRLSFEEAGSECFAGGDCQLQCERFGTNTECIATMHPTTSPSSSPTITAASDLTFAPTPSEDSTVAPTPSDGLVSQPPTMSSAPSSSSAPTGDGLPTMSENTIFDTEGNVIGDINDDGTFVIDCIVYDMNGRQIGEVCDNTGNEDPPTGILFDNEGNGLGYVDADGSVVIPGNLVADTNGNPVGWVNEFGAPTIDCVVYDANNGDRLGVICEETGDLSIGILFDNEGNGLGYVDTDGTVVIPGNLLVDVNGDPVGWVNDDGTTVVDCVVYDTVNGDQLGSICEGTNNLTTGPLIDSEENGIGYVDIDGTVVIPGDIIFDCNGEAIGWFKESGDLVIDCIAYDAAGNELAVLCKSSGNLTPNCPIFDSNGNEIGFIGPDGNVSVSPATSIPCPPSSKRSKGSKSKSKSYKDSSSTSKTRSKSKSKTNRSCREEPGKGKGKGNTKKGRRGPRKGNGGSKELINHQVKRAMKGMRPTLRNRGPTDSSGVNDNDLRPQTTAIDNSRGPRHKWDNHIETLYYQALEAREQTLPNFQQETRQSNSGPGDPILKIQPHTLENQKRIERDQGYGGWHYVALDASTNEVPAVRKFRKHPARALREIRAELQDKESVVSLKTA